MAFYHYYKQTKVLLKNEELEVVVSMVGDIPDRSAITPMLKNVSRNDFLYPMLAKEFPGLKEKLWWQPCMADKVTAKVKIL